MMLPKTKSIKSVSQRLTPLIYIPFYIVPDLSITSRSRFCYTIHIINRELYVTY